MMKTLKSMAIFAAATLSLVACKKGNDPVAPQEVEVAFTASIGNLRASGTTWSDGDAIGIYALRSGAPLATGVYNGKENIKYTADVAGKLTAAGTKITYPADGASLDFIAYYPYTTRISANKYPINVAAQSNLTAIDLLYSNNAKGLHKEQPEAALTFSHRLSLVTVTLNLAEASTENLSVSVTGLKSDGTFDLADGSIALGNSTATLTPTLKGEGSTRTFEMILIPTSDLGTAKFRFTAGTKAYEWTPTAQLLESNKHYKYVLKLEGSGQVEEVDAEFGGATIIDWEDVTITGNQIDLEPINGSVEPENPPTPTVNGLLFAGADFEDLAVLTANISTHGLKHATLAEGGKNGKGLKISTTNTTTTANDFIFSAVAKGASFAGKTKISFYLKGTAVGKSISVNVYTTGSNKIFNLGTVADQDITVTSSGQNSYGGSINTNGKWIKVTLDISGFAGDIAVKDNLIAVKIGKEAAFDIMLDEITVE